MREIDTQLRTYFDQSVERITEEDVRIRATTERGVPVASPRFRPRPLAAAAIGFGLAMTLIGAVLVVDRVFGAGMSDAGGGGGSAVGVTQGGDQGSPWLFIPVVLGLGLLATGIISALRRNGDGSERGEGFMQTFETVEAVETPLDKQILTLKKRDRWLAWLAGILAVAVVAMGAWMIFGDDGGRSPTAEQAQTLDDFAAAWNAGDGEAAAALMMPSGYHDNGGIRYPVAEGEFADYVEMTHAMGLEIQDNEERVRYGDFVVSYTYLTSTDTQGTFGVFKMTPDGNRILWHLAP